MEGQSISPSNEQSSSSWELRGLTSVGLAALHQEEHAVCSNHQAKWDGRVASNSSPARVGSAQQKLPGSSEEG